MSLLVFHYCFEIVSVAVAVAVTVSIHLHVVCHHFICQISLF